MKYNRELRNWNRSELAAIVGVPLEIPIEFVIAGLGETRSSIRASVANQSLQTHRVGRQLFVPTYQLLKPEGYSIGNSPMMLRAGELVPRPSFDSTVLRQTFDSQRTINVGDVQTLTHQTREEVVADLLARRLRGFPSFQTRWSINLDQFEHGFVAESY